MAGINAMIDYNFFNERRISEFLNIVSSILIHCNLQIHIYVLSARWRIYCTNPTGTLFYHFTATYYTRTVTYIILLGKIAFFIFIFLNLPVPKICMEIFFRSKKIFYSPTSYAMEEHLII